MNKVDWHIEMGRFDNPLAIVGSTQRHSICRNLLLWMKVEAVKLAKWRDDCDDVIGLGHQSRVH